MILSLHPPIERGPSVELLLLMEKRCSMNHRREATRPQEPGLVLSPPPHVSASFTRGAPSQSRSRAFTQSSFPLFPHQRIQDQLPAVVSDDDGVRSGTSLTKPSQPNASKLSYDSACNRERELSCVSFASREPENSSFLKYLSSIHFRPRNSQPKLSLQRGADVSVENNYLLRDRPVNKAVRKTTEDVTLLSFFENGEDDDSVRDYYADDGDNFQSLLHPTSVGRKSNHHFKKWLGKYSESISCILPNFSSVSPSSSPSNTPEHRSLEEYQPHFRDDEDEIEVTFYPEPSEKTLNDYTVLLQDPAYLHAQQAGFLWQSLVGQHVRFPYHWWKGLRGPPMSLEGNVSNPWYHVGSCAVRSHKALQRIVKNRAAPGRLLLHVLVRDALSGDIICDLAVGCYHPNARGVRLTLKPDPSKETTRHVWMAFRNRTRWSVAVIEQWIQSEVRCRSPIGKGPITNGNILVVYGEKPPLETLLLSENSLSELHGRANKHYPLPLMLCESFVFN